MKIPFEAFEALYLAYMQDDDRPTCHIAYLRAEADMLREFGQRRHANYNTFRVLLCRARQRRKTKKQSTCKQKQLPVSSPTT